jgi:hypothetical protein
MPGTVSLVPPQGPPQAADRPCPGPHRAAQRKEVTNALRVSIPLVALLGAVVFLAWRFMGLRVWQALLCLLFGFFLAATTAAPQISHLVTGIVQWLTTSKP